MSEFRRLFDLGYVHLLPIIPPDAVVSEKSTLFKRPKARGKTPGVLGHNGWHSFDWASHTTTETDLSRWLAMGAGVGIRCGEMPDGTWVVLIDADTLNPVLAAVIQAEIDRRFPGAPRRVGRAPKAGTVLRLSGPLPYCRVDFDDGVDPNVIPRVEILTAGRQFVAAGIHPDTRQPYAWPAPLIPYADLPIHDPAEVMAFLEALAAVLPAAKPVVTEGSAAEYDQERLRGDAERVRQAVAAIPNTSTLFGTRESYLAMGYAIKAAIPDEFEARDVWAEWCARWVDGENDPERDDAEWRRMKPPFRRGAGWLYDLAEEHGGGAFSRAGLWFEEPLSEGEAPLFGFGDGDEAGQGSGDVEPIDIFNTFGTMNLSEPPEGALPDTVLRWARSEARRKGVSLAFAAAAAVGVLGAAIGSSLMVRPRLHDTGWTEPAALWFALIAEPGRGKSPIISAAAEPLRKLDDERYAVDHAFHKAWAAAEALHRKRKDAPEPGPEPKIRRCYVDDATLEKQVRIHADNPRGLLRAPDELRGLFASLGAYKRNADGDRTQVLRLFEGASIVVDRVGAGSIRASHALMGIVAGTQPAIIRALVQDLGQDGMLQRFLFLVDDHVVREGVDEEPDGPAMTAYRTTVRYLATADHGASGKVVEQTPEARAELVRALSRMRLLRDLPGASVAWKGHVEKWPKLLHRIALVFHVVRHVEAAGGLIPGVLLDVETARQAVAFGWFLLRHSLSFYEAFFGESAAMSDAKAFAGYLLTRPDLGTLSRRDVYQGNRALRGDDKARVLTAAMGELENMGWVTALERDYTGPKRWSVNPRVHTAFAEQAERERRERRVRQDAIGRAGTTRREELEQPS